MRLVLIKTNKIDDQGRKKDTFTVSVLAPSALNKAALFKFVIRIWRREWHR